MDNFSKEERAYMREKGITICSLCRYMAEGRVQCKMKLNIPAHSASGSCLEFAVRSATPEEQRIAAMRAAEAQLSLFGEGGR